MEGIDRIKQHILAEAEAEIEALDAETRALVDQEISKAETECGIILDQARKRAQHDAEQIIKRAESVADSLVRKQALESRQALADRIIYQALELLRKKSAPERVALYAAWIRALGTAEGVITLSAADRAEIGEDLLKALPHGRFTLDPQAGDFSGGVLVTHGRIRDNLTYDVIMRDHRPELAREALAFPGLGGEGRDD